MKKLNVKNFISVSLAALIGVSLGTIIGANIAASSSQQSDIQTKKAWLPFTTFNNNSSITSSEFTFVVEDNKEQASPNKNTILSSFVPLAEDIAFQSIVRHAGTSPIQFPSNMVGFDEEGNTIDIPVISWESSPYFDDSKEGMYVFTPTFADTYTVKADLPPPEIHVFVGTFFNIRPVSTSLVNYWDPVSEAVLEHEATDLLSILKPSDPSAYYELISGWYFVPESTALVLDRTIKISGDVTIILGSSSYFNTTVDLDAGFLPGSAIRVEANSSLTIFSDQNNTGILIANSASKKDSYIGHAGIYVDKDAALTLNGGGITASSVSKTKYDGAGIGGNVYTITTTPTYPEGFESDCGTVTINGGIITATGGEFCAGIGGGYTGGAKNITIAGNKAYVTAFAGPNGAGIGSGLTSASCEITINGGNISANSVGSHGPAIGGGEFPPHRPITINGGFINAASDAFFAIGGISFQESPPHHHKQRHYCC